LKKNLRLIAISVIAFLTAVIVICLQPINFLDLNAYSFYQQGALSEPLEVTYKFVAKNSSGEVVRNETGLKKKECTDKKAEAERRGWTATCTAQ